MDRARRSRQRDNIGMRLGAIVRDGRERSSVSMSELAERTGMSRQMVGAVEGGRANPTLDVLVRLLDGLGLELDIAVRGPVVIGTRRSDDAAHAICSGYVQRRLEAAGWMTAREVRIDDGRYVGWIDLLAFHEPTGTLLVIEIKTRIEDLGAIERSMDWYLRNARSVARRFGWRPRSVGGWLVVLATAEVEGRIREDSAALAAAFPARAREMSINVENPATLRQARGLALIDPRSRRREWLIRSKVDGRRSDPPYGGYAQFMAGRRTTTSRGRRTTR